MAFNRDNFDENVDYCEYVYRKKSEYGLQLSDEDIQHLANMYAFELDSMDLFDEDEVVENDEVLLRVYDEYVFSVKNPKCDFIDYDKEEALCQLKLRQERIINSMGGYALNDDFDDFSPEERNANFALKFKKGNDE